MENENKRKLRASIILLLIAVSSIIIRLLMHYRFDKSALLYIGFPFAIALAIMWIDRPSSKGNWKREFASHLHNG